MFLPKPDRDAVRRSPGAGGHRKVRGGPDPGVWIAGLPPVATLVEARFILIRQIRPDHGWELAQASRRDRSPSPDIRSPQFEIRFLYPDRLNPTDYSARLHSPATLSTRLTRQTRRHANEDDRSGAVLV